MRFRGGGVGHGYMRWAEPWLDSTGWGATWPSFNHRIPDPGPTRQANTDSQVNSSNTGAIEGDGDGGGGEEGGLEQLDEDGEGCQGRRGDHRRTCT